MINQLEAPRLQARPSRLRPPTKFAERRASLAAARKPRGSASGLDLGPPVNEDGEIEAPKQKFKAPPLGSLMSSSAAASGRQSKVTQQVPFRLSTSRGARMSERRARTSITAPRLSGAQQYATRMSYGRRLSTASNTSVGSVTVQTPFSLASLERHRKTAEMRARAAADRREAESMTPRFRAKPLPKFYKTGKKSGPPPNKVDSASEQAVEEVPYEEEVVATEIDIAEDEIVAETSEEASMQD
eukprot:IDg12801t1